MPNHVLDPHSGLYLYEKSLNAAPDPTPSVFTTTRNLLHILHCEDPAAVAEGQVALTSLLKHQYDCPGMPHHGSWKRTPDELPPDQALHWLDFDPNFREFVGTTLLCVLQDFAHDLTPVMVASIEAALRRAVEGALTRELTPDYSNIALLHAWFVAVAGQRLGRDDWFAYGEDFAEKVFALFQQHGCFDEFNSPTYLVLDLEALALWIERPPSLVFESHGRAMEQATWQEIADFYHAGLRNLCGPYDRAYYVNLLKDYKPENLGRYINALVGPEGRPFDVPAVDASLVSRCPIELREHFRTFQGERLLERTITDTPYRLATSWLDHDVMIGAQDSHQSKLVWRQYHMATMHWRVDANEIGVITLRPTMITDAKAGRGKLSTWTYVWAGSGESDIDFCWLIQCSGLSADMITDDAWHLPGLDLAVITNSRNRRVELTDEGLAVHFSGNNRDAGTWLRFDLSVVPRLSRR